eukprot:UN24910
MCVEIFLQVGILWEGKTTWSKLLLNTRIALTILSGLEKKQDDVLSSWESATL